MKKPNLKKMLALALCLLMSISAMTLFASADAATTPTFAKTVYMSSTGVDTNDGLSEAKAVATLEKATEILGENGGEIIIVNDMTIDLSAYEKLASGRRMFLAKTNATVYLHGKKQADNTFPDLLFKTGGAAAIFELAGPFAIYDLGIGMVEEQNIWISANGYPLTIGENVTTVMQGTKVANITGGRQDNGTSGVLRAADAECVVTIFSGVWGQIYGGSFAKDSVQTGGAVLNMIGGQANLVRGARDGSKVTGEVVINFYGGEVVQAWNTYTGIGSHAAEGRTNILNIYNNSMSDATKANLGGVYAADVTENAGTVNNVTGTAPEFFTISAYDFAPPAPPTFEDDPDLGVNGDDDLEPNDTKASETKAPETKAPETEAPAEEEKGCGGVIGASALVIAAVMGTAVVLGKKRED